MSKKTRTFEPWMVTQCDKCGCDFQMTRREPATCVNVLCETCVTWEVAYKEGFAAGKREESEKSLLSCPFCGGDPHHTEGDKDTRMIDQVMCLDCCVIVEGSYTVNSSLSKWNTRTKVDK